MLPKLYLIIFMHVSFDKFLRPFISVNVYFAYFVLTSKNTSCFHSPSMQSPICNKRIADYFLTLSVVQTLKSATVTRLSQVRVIEQHRWDDTDNAQQNETVSSIIFIRNPRRIGIACLGRFHFTAISHSSGQRLTYSINNEEAADI